MDGSCRGPHSRKGRVSGQKKVVVHPLIRSRRSHDSAVFWRGDGSLRYVLRAIRVLHPILVIE
jgi:hypothetical protein